MSSVSSVNSNSASQLIDLYTTGSSSATNDITSTVLDAVDGSSDSSSDSVELSSSGVIYSKLKELSKTDNDEFKSVCAEIANKLIKNAQTGGSSMLTLASKFAAAAESGDMSDLETTSSTSSTDYSNPYYVKATLNESLISTLLGTGSSDSSSSLSNLIETMRNSTSSD